MEKGSKALRKMQHSCIFLLLGLSTSSPFLVTKKVGLPEESHYKRVSPHGGDTLLLFIQKNQ